MSLPIESSDSSVLANENPALALAKELVVWVLGLAFSADVACVAKLLAAKASGNPAPPFLLPAILALSTLVLYSVLVFLRIVFLADRAPPEAVSPLRWKSPGLPSLAALLLCQILLLGLCMVLVLLWIL